MELRELLKIIVKWFWMISTMTVLTTATVGIASYYYIAPEYEASTQLVLTNPSTGKDQLLNDIQSSLKLIDTYIVIIQSPHILEKVLEGMKMNMSTSALKDMMKVKTIQNSQVISLTVRNSDPKIAVALANDIAQVFQDEVSNIMNINNVKILSEAKMEDTITPVSPKPVLNMGIAFVCSLSLSIGLSILIEYILDIRRKQKGMERTKFSDLKRLGQLP